MNKKTIGMYFGSTLYQALFSDHIYIDGMGTMILTRKTAGGAIVGVCFLCDHYCLGVKDCYPFMENEATYLTLLRRIRENEELKNVDAGVLKQYILGLVQWAKEIGFTPHADYRFCSEILKGFRADEEATFTYGKNGVPTYVNGPYETPAQMSEIIGTLMAYKERTGNEADYILMGQSLDAFPGDLIQALPPKIRMIE